MNHGCLKIHDTGNKEGTRYVYSLNLCRLFRRNTLPIIPMPNVVIDALEDMYLTEEESESTDTPSENGEDKESVGDEASEDGDTGLERYNDSMPRTAGRFVIVNRSDGWYDPVSFIQSITVEDDHHLEGVAEDSLTTDDYVAQKEEDVYSWNWSDSIS